MLHLVLTTFSCQFASSLVSDLQKIWIPLSFPKMRTEHPPCTQSSTRRLSWLCHSLSCAFGSELRWRVWVLMIFSWPGPWYVSDRDLAILAHWSWLLGTIVGLHWRHCSYISLCYQRRLPSYLLSRTRSSCRNGEVKLCCSSVRYHCANAWETKRWSFDGENFGSPYCLPKMVYLHHYGYLRALDCSHRYLHLRSMHADLCIMEPNARYEMLG